MVVGQSKAGENDCPTGSSGNPRRNAGFGGVIKPYHCQIVLSNKKALPITVALSG